MRRKWYQIGARTFLRRRFGQLQRIISDRQSRRIFHKFRDFTMVPERSFKANLAVAQQVRSISGCVVECGVWRGGMSAGLCHVLGPNREYFLLDSYEGLPPAQEIDGQAALRF